MRWRAEDVRGFVQRDWGALHRAPVSRTSAENHALAAALYEQARAAVPGWPSDADRDEDLAAHERLSALFQRIHDARQRTRAR